MAQAASSGAPAKVTSAGLARNRFLSFINALERPLERYAFAFAAIASGIYLASAIALARAKPLWFDEFITLYIARLGSPVAIWRTLAAGVDQNPPVLHFVTAAAERVFGDSVLALRVPAIVAYWAMSAGVFVFVQKRLGKLYGLLAAAIPLISGVFAYSYEARSYALMFACAAWSLAGWQMATSGRRVAGIVVMTVGLALGVSSHYYSVLLFVPIAVGELVRTVVRYRGSGSRRSIDFPVWGAVVLSGLMLLVYLPLIRTDLRLYKDHAWNRPTHGFLALSYPEILMDLIWPFFGLACAYVLWKAVATWRRAGTSNGLTVHENAAVLSYALLPVFGLALAQFGSGQLSTRYVMAAIVGFAILAAAAVSEIAQKRVAVALCCLLAIFSHFVPEVFDRVEKQHLTMADAMRAPSPSSETLPIVIENPLIATQARHYWTGALSQRIVFPIDFEAAREFKHEDSAEVTINAGRSIFPMTIEGFDDFRHANRDYLFYGTDKNWVTEKLRSEGATLEVEQQVKPYVLLHVREK